MNLGHCPSIKGFPFHTMEKHLMIKQNPSADTMKKQLQAVKDQWQLLKQTANGQSGVPKGARNLQQFHKMADQLEAWIRGKEEKPSLTGLLAESSDKMYLTRRILDLKQEQQQFKHLHEDVNNLAQNLEKHGKTESKGTSTRRKHLNKMWLRVQRTLKEHQQILQLALEASSFYQQADALLQAMDSKRKIMCGLRLQGDPESCGDQDLRDIAGQVMMLDVMVSQLSSIHPSLAARVILRHQQVRDGWVQLQEAVRSQKLTHRSCQGDLDGSTIHSLSSERAEESDTGKQLQGTAEQELETVHTNVVQRGSVMYCELSEGKERSPARNIQEAGSDVTSEGHTKLTRKKPALDAEAQKVSVQQETQLYSFCQTAASMLSCLRENISMVIHWSETENVENLEEVRRQHEAMRQAMSRNQSRMEMVTQEGRRLLRLSPPACAKVEKILRGLEGLWGELKKRHEESEAALQESDEAQRLLEVLTEADAWLQTLHESLSEPVAMQSPELIRNNLQETSSLDTEVLSHGITLQVLREQTTRITRAGNSLAGTIQRKLEMVEEKYWFVRDSLRRRTSDLRDSLVLAEFLQNVLMEEGLKHRNMTSMPSHIRPEGKGQPRMDREYMESMSCTLDELQEAVRLLNEALHQRERAAAAARETENLLHLLPGISNRITSTQTIAQQLSRDIGFIQKEITAVKRKSCPRDLQELQRQQHDIEVTVSGVLHMEMSALQHRLAVLQDLGPSRVHGVAAQMQEIFQAWGELQHQVVDNQSRLQGTMQLHQFCGTHLAIMSWVQDIRSETLPEDEDLEGLSKAQRQEMEQAMQRKIQQFRELTAAGGRLITEDHFLTDTVKERVEEARQRLGSMLIHWRSPGKLRSTAALCVSEEFQDGCSDIPGEKQEVFQGPISPDVFLQCQSSGCLGEPSVHGTQPQRAETESGSPLHPWPIQDSPGSCETLLEQNKNSPFLGQETAGEALTLGPSEIPVVITPQSTSGSLGETVNLILRIKKQDVKIEERARRVNVLQQVSTSLHVKDTEMEERTASQSLTMPRPSKKMQSKIYLTPASSGGHLAACHTLPNISTNAILTPLKRKEKTETDTQRLTVQRIKGMNPNSTRPLPRDIKHHTATWPLKQNKKWRGPDTVYGEVLDYMKNPLARDIEAVGPVLDFGPSKPQSRILSRGDSKPAQRHCSCKHLSLGSVLSITLPKDLSLLDPCQDAVKITPQVVGETEEAGLDTGLRLSRPVHGDGDSSTGGAVFMIPRVKSKQHLVTGGREGIQGDGVRCAPENKSSWIENQHKPQRLSSGEDSVVTQDQEQSGEDLLNFRLPRTSVLHEQVVPEWDRLAAVLNTPSNNDSSRTEKPIKEIIRKQCASSPIKNGELHTHSTMAGPAGTRVNENLKARCDPFIKDEQCLTGISPEPLVNVDLKASNQLSVFDYEIDHQDANSKAIKSSEEANGCRPGMVVQNLTKLKPKTIIPTCLLASSHVLNPNNAVFQEVEEELEDIWNNVERFRHSSCLDMAFQTAENKKEEGTHKAQTLDCRRLIDDVAVIKSVMPSSAQGEKREGERGRSVNTDLREHSSHREPRETFCQIKFSNVCASDFAGPPCTPDQQNHSYKRQEEEVKDPDRAENPRIAEFLLMEGTLEKKHTLQQGRKKATCRTWSTYHAVLVRRTLCFYQDRKDPIKSSVFVMPLTLTGAVCFLEVHYTKKPNVFQLCLADGSEYLLQAPSAALTQEWVTKIQHNADVGEADLFPLAMPVPKERSCLAAGVSLHQPVPTCSNDVSRLPLSRAQQQLPYGHLEAEEGLGQQKAIFVQRTVWKEQPQWTPAGSLELKDNGHHNDGSALSTENRRSYSFSTGTQHKLGSDSTCEEATETGSSVVPTLYVRERCHSSGAPQDSSLQKDVHSRVSRQTAVAGNQQQERGHSVELWAHEQNYKATPWATQHEKSHGVTPQELHKARGIKIRPQDKHARSTWEQQNPAQAKNRSVFKKLFQKTGLN